MRDDYLNERTDHIVNVLQSEIGVFTPTAKEISDIRAAVATDGPISDEEIDLIVMGDEDSDGIPQGIRDKFPTLDKVIAEIFS